MKCRSTALISLSLCFSLDQGLKAAERAVQNRELLHLFLIVFETIFHHKKQIP